MSKYRGHNIEFVYETWIYSDTKIPISDDKNILCGHCGREQTKEGYDGCIGTIRGAMNACCGHGNDREAYIQYPNGIIRGDEALKIMNLSNKGE